MCRLRRRWDHPECWPAESDQKTSSNPGFCDDPPRGGDFIYSPGELEAMQEDITLLRELGADGFVFGVLQSSGEVDQDACQRLIETAGGKPCTFHRAFDKVPDQLAALEIIIGLGFKRILTSGGKNSVPEGSSSLLEVLIQAAHRITVLPGVV